jgi:acyl-CoA thioester hydrolase
MGLQKGAVSEAALKLWTGRVLDDWADYNGHMTEHRYLQVFGESTDQLLAHIGVDFSQAIEGAFYTLETHIRHLRECRPGTLLWTSTELLGYDDRKMHTYHRLFDSTDKMLATGEHLSIHVARSKACRVSSGMLQRISAIFEQQRQLPNPEGSGLVLTERLAHTRTA